MYILPYNEIEVIKMCYVTATELKNNLSYYLEKSMTEDVFITKNKKVISVLSNPQLKALYELKALVKETKKDSSVNMSDKDIIIEGIEKR